MRKGLYLSHHFLDLPDRGTSMNRRLIRLQRHSLPAIAMLFIVSLMSPTGAVAAPSCEKNPNHPNCDDGSGGSNGGGDGDLYTVDVYFGDDVVHAGGADHVEGTGNKSRPKIGDANMILDLSLMGTQLGDECAGEFGINERVDGPFFDGEFAAQTARRPQNSPTFTYITASFWNFVSPDVNGSTYFLVFGPGDDGTIINQDNWPPAGDEFPENENYMSGNWLELQVVNGPAKRGPCDKLRIPLAWKIVVTKE